ncbi:MAG: class I SAM-dependent methyltransferase, partial [Candidatus Korarchaeota archaeon]|nr:class I SAM-dependent methyltransferase [Candidatus Korarchaeota archaeon]
LDPLPSMLKAAFDNLRGIAGDVELNFLEATFESIPLPNSSVDVIVTAYALRDARDLYGALSEFKRVLKPGGQLLVLDLVRPDNRAFAWLVDLYLRTLVPLISIPIYGSLDTPWKALYPTFRIMLTASEFTSIIGEEFEVIKVKRALLGTFVAIKARRT